MEWEKLYVEAIIDHLCPVGDVLEVGFDFGYSAAHTQTYHPRHHTIIEAEPETAERAIKWAGNNTVITIIQDRWKNILPTLGVFDTIFYNDFDPEFEAEKKQYCEMGESVVRQGRAVIENAKQQFPQMMNMRYSDADIEEFFNQVGQFQAKEMETFLQELAKNEQLSMEQYNKLLLKYDLGKKTVQPNKASQRQKSCLLQFLDACLKDHMRKGSRFSCFAPSPTSKFEDPEFFASIITNPNYDYEEKLIPVDVPKSCDYYNYNEALIMVVTKQA